MRPGRVGCYSLINSFSTKSHNNNNSYIFTLFNFHFLFKHFATITTTTSTTTMNVCMRAYQLVGELITTSQIKLCSALSRLLAICICSSSSLNARSFYFFFCNYYDFVSFFLVFSSYFIPRRIKFAMNNRRNQNTVACSTSRIQFIDLLFILN